MSNQTTKIAKLPKSFLKGAEIGSVHYGNVILTHSLSCAKKIKANVLKSGRKDIMSFEITDKQFGMINITFGDAPAIIPAPFKHGIISKKGNQNIAIPVTLKQMGNDWVSYFNKNI